MNKIVHSNKNLFDNGKSSVKVRNQMTALCILSMAALAGMSACKSLGRGSKSETRFEVATGKEGLLNSLGQMTVTVCLVIDSRHWEQSEPHYALLETWTSSAFKAWVAPLKQADARLSALTLKINRTCVQNWDARIMVTNATVPNHTDLGASYVPFANRQPTMVLRTQTIENPKFGYRVYQHEWGHLFGLRDTYSDRKNDTQMNCKLGHPTSVMCSPQEFDSLQLDDVAGILAAYRGTANGAEIRLTGSEDSAVMGALLDRLTKQIETLENSGDPNIAAFESCHDGSHCIGQEMLVQAAYLKEKLNIPEFGEPLDSCIFANPSNTP